MAQAGGRTRHAAGAGSGFAQVTPDLGEHVSGEVLLAALKTPDARVENTSVSSLELEGVSADGTAFENVVFRGCTFDRVNLSGCTFTDVVFSDCRFVGCDMGRSWLNRCDFRSCSAPGLTFLKGRLTGVSMTDSQMGYCDLARRSFARVLPGSTSPPARSRASASRVTFTSCAAPR